MHVLGLASATTDLREQEIDTKWRILVIQVTLELGNLLSQHVRCVTNTTNNTKAASVSDSSSELGTSSHIHASQQNGVLDLEQISELGAELLYVMSAAMRERRKTTTYVEKTC